MNPITKCDKILEEVTFLRNEFLHFFTSWAEWNREIGNLSKDTLYYTPTVKNAQDNLVKHLDALNILIDGLNNPKIQQEKQTAMIIPNLISETTIERLEFSSDPFEYLVSLSTPNFLITSFEKGIVVCTPEIYKAAIFFSDIGNMKIERVAFFSYSESINLKLNKNEFCFSSQISSQYIIFQQISAHSMSTLQYFITEKPSKKISLLYFINWISSYYNLFSSPCMFCNRILQEDVNTKSFIPPILRTISGAPIHANCKSTPFPQKSNYN